MESLDILNMDARLKEIVLNFPDMVRNQDLKEFNKVDYKSSLSDYTDSNRKTFEALQNLCLEHPDRQEEILREACGILMDAVERDLADPEKCRGLNGRALLFDTYKMVIVTYLTPAVYRMELEISGPFNDILHEEWIRRYPKHPYQKVSEEIIAAGFERKWYQCYITQAVCGYLGKADDGYELTSFRTFRDTYLRSCPDGPDLIREYYRTAPAIVTRIELSGEGDRIYPELWNAFLKPCLSCIEQGEPEKCRERYIQMVRKLQKEYLFTE